jgi:hypothetical protein
MQAGQSGVVTLPTGPFTPSPGRARHDDSKYSLFRPSIRHALPRLHGHRGAGVTGALWSADLGWLLATIVLAGIFGGILALEVDSGFRLAKALCSYLVALARRDITEWKTRR